MESGAQKGGSAWGRVARIALAVSAVALAAEFMAGEGTRLGWWPFRTGFGVLGRAAWAGLAGAVVSAVALAATWKRGEKGRAAMSGVGLVLGLLAVAIPGTFYLTAKVVPMIHDITTDTADPPAFVALLDVRKASPNGSEYGGPEVAEKQRAAYPDIKPVDLGVPPAAAFDKALAAARSLGWKIAESDAAAGRIEATDTTRWFGFKDDVVIRVRLAPSGAGSRVDVRSVSRVGKSDIGKNAARIREFSRALTASP